MILAAIDVAVIYFTMQICGIAPRTKCGMLPSGAAVRVSSRAERRLPRRLHRRRPDARKDGSGHQGRFRRNRLLAGSWPRVRQRSCAWLVLAVPAGLGFLTVLSRDHRGVHDRFAGTRVVRASLVNRPFPWRSPQCLESATCLSRRAHLDPPWGCCCGWCCRHPPVVQAATIVALFVVGSIAGNVAERHFRRTDPRQVVHRRGDGDAHHALS